MEVCWCFLIQKYLCMFTEHINETGARVMDKVVTDIYHFVQSICQILQQLFHNTFNQGNSQRASQLSGWRRREES